MARQPKGQRVALASENLTIRKVPALVVVVLTSACLPRPPPASEQPTPEIVLEGVNVWIYRGPEVAAIGHALRGVYDRAAGSGTADTVAFHVAPSGRDLRQGGRASKGVDIDSKSVIGGLRTQIADASGGVTVRTGVGDRAKTPNAHYEGASRIVEGHDGVTVDGPEYHLTAPAYRLSLADERLELLGGGHVRTGEKR
jgi:lipopolysaccharide export system protein LptC